MAHRRIGKTTDMTFYFVEYHICGLRFATSSNEQFCRIDDRTVRQCSSGGLLASDTSYAQAIRFSEKLAKSSHVREYGMTFIIIA
jgi:hypothetical protein